MFNRFENLLDRDLTAKEMEEEKCPFQVLIVFNPLGTGYEILQWNVCDYKANRIELLLLKRFLINRLL